MAIIQQRQSLNEVENLYFAHSHQRGPKFLPPSMVATTTQTEVPQPTAGSTGANAQAPFSFFPRTTSSVRLPEANRASTSTPPSGVQSSGSSQTQTPVLSSAVPSTSTSIRPIATSTNGNASSSFTQLPPTPTSPNRPPPTATVPQTTSHYTGTFGVYTSPSTSTPRDSTPTSASMYPTMIVPPSPSRARAKLPTKSPASQPPSHHYRDRFSYTLATSGTAMTYDAFWSTHSSPRPAVTATPPTRSVVSPSSTSSSGPPANPVA
ncbi:hypothetical protein CC1G_06465 [Coprinopsis cinerea okayama7|uniref:Uncharacterized protein n=1 Tax=Coprinopsis cinerea (strain Okayama-7 / 130 / ATCC MYA-4618 / FGSC 9003) TaxID=240176 RepID=A8NN74_COPC7|nr:hypothetical protein CC1G_06465 [Coprinopsis cinerea okayama7\|eukprot:XP_001835062.1 hypothetical protein CC1G_06465 [Coprinopsis cinerea okayama7\